MQVIELVSKWEICWALWSLVVFYSDDDPTQNNVAWFLMGDFLRLSPWSGDFLMLCRKAQFCDQGFIVGLPCFLRVFLCTIVFFLIIVKSLQLRGHRQIAEPRKYCLVHVIVFFGMCFLYLFCFSQVEIWLNSLNLEMRLQVFLTWQSPEEECFQTSLSESIPVIEIGKLRISELIGLG